MCAVSWDYDRARVPVPAAAFAIVESEMGLCEYTAACWAFYKQIRWNMIERPIGSVFITHMLQRLRQRKVGPLRAQGT